MKRLLLATAATLSLAALPVSAEEEVIGAETGVLEEGVLAEDQLCVAGALDDDCENAEIGAGEQQLEEGLDAGDLAAEAGSGIAPIGEADGLAEEAGLEEWEGSYQDDPGSAELGPDEGWFQE